MKGFIILVYFCVGSAFIFLILYYAIEFFYKIKHNLKNKWIGEVYCFYCEIKTEIKKNKKGELYCSNCGLRH